MSNVATAVEHRAQQAHHFDHEVKDPGFEITRPRGGGRFYTFLMGFKVRTALRLLPHDVRGRTVLDICAGSGMDAELLVRRGAAVVCLDISEGALGRARMRAQRYGLDYSLLAGDAENLPFADGAFDFTFVHDGLHHLTDPERAIGEMARVSRRGLIITEPADAALTVLAIRLGIIEAEEEAGNLVYRFDPARLQPLLTRLGLPNLRSRRYLVKYPHQPGWLYRLLDLPVVYDLAQIAFLLIGGGLFGRVGNKLALVALPTATTPTHNGAAEQSPRL